MLNYYDVNGKQNQEDNSKLRDIVRWLLDSYYRATGIGVIFVDSKKKIISSGTYTRYFCQLCKLVQRNQVGKKRCLEVFHNSILRNVEYGFPYIYQCYAGLVEWSAPFYFEGELLGCFISGGVILYHGFKWSWFCFIRTCRLFT